MKKILFIFPYYLPGYRAGGPLQTIKNVVEVFGKQCDIYILALDHDMGVTEKYDDIDEGWNQVGDAHVMYVSDREYNFDCIVRLSQSVDIVYACSLFSKYTILTLLANKTGKIPSELVVAPMGVFSRGAMSQKSVKKRTFLKLFKWFGFFEDIKWSLSSELEKLDAEENIGKIYNYIIAEDLPRKIQYEVPKRNKQKNKLRVIFLSRICPKKNLDYCFDILDREWDGEIVFDIYGTKEDLDYWNRCEAKMNNLNKSVKCQYCGEVAPENVPKTFSKYDVFLFPTLGENFGHVIYEALSAGCMTIISDKTIWKDLEEKNCGRVVELQDLSHFVECIDEVLGMSNEEFEKVSFNAINYAKEKYRTSISNSGYRELFL